MLFPDQIELAGIEEFEDRVNAVEEELIAAQKAQKAE